MQKARAFGKITFVCTQIIKDLKAKGLPCASMHEAMEQSANVAVANNCALVGIFDQIPDSAQFVCEARS
jgi:hypothetical protein